MFGTAVGGSHPTGGEGARCRKSQLLELLTKAEP